MDMNEVTVSLRKFPDWDSAKLTQEHLLPKQAPDDECIQLCTSHSAKGMEWEHVFVIDCVDGLFPNHHAKTDEKREEELRVFYVSITRHKKRPD